MELKTFDRASIARLREALIAGEPVHLLARDLPAGLRIDEVAPLLSSVQTSNRRLKASFEARMPPPARGGEPIDITVVIPSHRRVPLAMGSLRSQDVKPTVLVLSNGDEGPTRVPGARVLQVPWRGHGATRQAAVQHVTSPWVFFTVDDAIPLGRGFLRTLVNALERSSWDAVVARQVPWPDAGHVTAERLRRWTPSGERTVDFPQADNVGTLYRTDVLRRFPFPDVPIGEDAWWSRGRRIGYVPFAPILHSHPRRPKALFARERALHEQLVLMGQDVPIEGVGDIVGALPGLLRPVVKGGTRELGSQLAELAGQWLGARRGRKW